MSYKSPASSLTLVDLDEERTRIGTLCYVTDIFTSTPDYMTYQAKIRHWFPVDISAFVDSPFRDYPLRHNVPYYVGDATVYLFESKSGEAWRQHDVLKNLNIHYYEIAGTSEYAVVG